MLSEITQWQKDKHWMIQFIWVSKIFKFIESESGFHGLGRKNFRVSNQWASIFNQVRWISSGDLLYNIVPGVRNNVLYTKNCKTVDFILNVFTTIKQS